MTQPYLYLRYRSSNVSHTKCAAFKEVDRQLSQIGNDFGASATSVVDTIDEYSRIIHWENDLYAIDVSGIWKYDVANSGDWGLLHTFANPYISTVAQTRRLGLTPCSVDGEPVLVCGYPEATSPEYVAIVRITQSGVFEDTPIDVSAADHSCISTATKIFGNPLSWRNNVVWSTIDEVILYDLKTGTPTITNPILGGFAYPALCVFRDKIFAIAHNSSSTSVRRLDGSNWTNVRTLHGNGNSSSASRQCLIIPFENKLCTFSFATNIPADSPYPGDTGGYRMYAGVLEFPPESTSEHTYTITSREVLGGDFGGWTDVTNPTRVYGGSRNPKWFARQDLLTDGVASQIIQVEFEPSNGHDEGIDSIDLFTFPAPSGALDFVGGGMDPIRFGRINNVDGTGGQFLWPGSGTLNISAPTLSVAGSNIYATCEIFGGEGSDGYLAAELLYDKEGEYVGTQATLNSTSVGSLSGNYVTGLSPGDIFTVSWSASVDGIGLGDNPKVAARVFVP